MRDRTTNARGKGYLLAKAPSAQLIVPGCNYLGRFYIYVGHVFSAVTLNMMSDGIISATKSINDAKRHWEKLAIDTIGEGTPPYAPYLDYPSVKAENQRISEIHRSTASTSEIIGKAVANDG